MSEEIDEKPEYRVIIDESFDSEEEADSVAERIGFCADVVTKVEEVPSLTLRIH